MSKNIEFCLSCDGYTRLEEDDYDFCKKCKIEEMRNWANTQKQLAEYFYKHLPETDKEKVLKEAWASIK